MADVNTNIQEEPVDLFDVPETVIDDFGQPSQAATLIISGLMAKVDSLQSKYRESLNIRQQWPTSTHIVTFGWLGVMIPSTSRNPYQQVTPDMKIVCQLDGRVLNILDAVNVNRASDMWYVICKEHFGATS